MTEYSTYILDKTEGSLRLILEDAFKKYWNMDAYTDHGTDIHYTYETLAKEVIRLHDFYRANGIMPGDKVALCSKNCSNWAVVMISFLTYGAVAVPILSDFHANQILNIVEHSESKLLFCSQSWYDQLKDNIKVPIISLNALPTDKNTHCDLKAEDIHFEREDSEDLCLLNYTSGSTGNSKGVMLPYRVLWSNVIFADERFRQDPCEKLVSLLPAAHMYGYAFEFLYEFCIGIHVHFLSKAPSPTYLMQVFADVKPHFIISVPLIIEKIAQGMMLRLKAPEIQEKMAIPGAKEVVLAQIREKFIELLGGRINTVIIGGASFSKEVENFLLSIKFPVTVGYGMTECGPIISYQDWHLFSPGSCGIPAPRMEVKIDSPDPAIIPGEIICRGTNVMLGYYKNPEATAEAIDKDGWLHTGDLATMDAAENIYIRGRKKNLLLGANGQNIYPEEIESTINIQTIFDETVVVQRGEKLVALVYVSDDTLAKAGLTREALEGQLDDIRNAVNEHLPKFANITGFEIQANEFEKTPKRNIKRYLYL